MSYELHDMVLGAAMRYHKEHWKSLKPMWNPEVFGDPARIKIAKAIADISTTHDEIALPIIFHNVGYENQNLIMNLYTEAPVQMNVEWMMRQIVEWHKIKSALPELSAAMKEVLSAKETENSDKMIAKIANVVSKMVEAKSEQKDSCQMHDILESTIDKILTRMQFKDELESGRIKTGIEKLDAAIHGIKGGRLYIIAARPSVGKTSFATFICLEALKQGKKPLFFSNEMDKEDIMEKMISSMSGIPAKTLQTGTLNDFQNVELHKTITNLGKLNLIIDEKSGWSLDQLIATVHAEHAKGRCDMVFVDYIQQVRVPKCQTKTEQVSLVSDAMKKLSRDLDIPVICLAQINREAEKTNGKDAPVPSMIHIKDSGSIEQDADVVIILHRPDDGHDDSSTDIIMRLAKNRHGMVGQCHLKFNHSICRYTQK